MKDERKLQIWLKRCVVLCRRLFEIDVIPRVVTILNDKSNSFVQIKSRFLFML